ncbi:MAG: hypothetical protein V5786_01975 [Psychromonas sp.]
MDTSELIIDYTVDNFVQSIRQLLPEGGYWNEVDNQALTQLILALASDFKTTSDETQLTLLSEASDTLFGWKLSDYQALLISSGASGLVYDDRASPNLIFVSLDINNRPENAWAEFEEKRLPHTEIQWIYNNAINVQTQVANARHIRNVTKNEVLS